MECLIKIFFIFSSLFHNFLGFLDVDICTAIIMKRALSFKKSWDRKVKKKVLQYVL